jgi:hypothetical protein
VPEIAREVDGGHAAATQLALYEIAVSEFVLKSDGEIYHLTNREGEGEPKDTPRLGWRLVISTDRTNEALSGLRHESR